MRSKLFVLGVSLLSISALRGQSPISSDEAKIHADLRGNSTSVSLPLANTADHPVKAELALAWLDSSDKETGTLHREITIQPGQSSVETALPLITASIWTRLRYALTPDKTDVRSFAPLGGIVSLSRIADYVFELSESSAGVAQRGRSITIHAEAIHPVTRLPIAGVNWKAMLSIDGRKIAPSRVSTPEDGFADFTFELPAATNDSGDAGSVDITGKRGDFIQSISLPLLIPSHLSARLQSDKPIYQPGQTVHLRAIVLDPQGRAAPNTTVSLRIDDQDHERAHTIELVTSKFGVVQDDWPIPSAADTGIYEIWLAGKSDDNYRIGDHSVRISRYDLPTFSVNAKPDRTAYLPTEQTHVAVTGTYLFGKPVPKGHVKINRTENEGGDFRTAKSESAGKIVAEGDTADGGVFNATLDLKDDHEDLRRNEDDLFSDLHFAAYYTDVSSGRTEQRRFDIRITREPIHVYVIRSVRAGSLPMPVYISTSYADGRPAPATVEILSQGRSTILHTNRYGVGKTMLLSNDEIEAPQIKATDAAGLTGSWREREWLTDTGLVQIDTDHTIYRAGEAVTLHLTSSPDVPPDQSLLVQAIAGDRETASRIVRIVNHQGEVSFPYQSEFRRTVIFQAWGSPASREAREGDALGSGAVIFPGGSDLALSVSTGQNTYKPGSQAALQLKVTSEDRKPVEAAIGLAVVDQAVMERAQTDSDFGGRRWFDCAFCPDGGETEIGGVRLNDLYALKPGSPVSADLDLVAEALVAAEPGILQSRISESAYDVPKFTLIESQMKQITEMLDRRYAQSLDLPEDFPALNGVLGRLWSQLRDPWGESYSAVFGVEDKERIISLMSSGPDKRAGTADDFVAGTFRREYFTAARQLIERILNRQTDYPATSGDFVRILSENGILLSALRDPWGTPYRSDAMTFGATRNIAIQSAGPDQQFGTKDDFVVTHFTGTYFAKETALIVAALHQAARAPQNTEEFRATLENAGIDISHYRDAWGRPYRLTSVISAGYSDRITTTTTRDFGSSPLLKTEITPVTRKVITFSLHSAGGDGIENTYDDFNIGRFPVVLTETSAGLPTSATPPRPAVPPGTGTILGVVTDQSGAVIANVKVTLFDGAGRAYESASGEDGVFGFIAVPAGMYSVRAESAGFNVYVVSNIPVGAGKTTNTDIELQVGTVSESVSVEADTVQLQTESFSLSPLINATPRVREYFPETLLWLPEIVTDKSGEARQQIPLADSVTTWKIAVIASTEDGRIAEAESDFRTFQPFFIDFNPPSILTEGDQVEMPVTIRNYRDRGQKVNVSIQPNQWSSLQGLRSQQVMVPAQGSVNVSYAVQARSSVEKGTQRIIATGPGGRDAIEKSSRVHPDGQEVERNAGDLITSRVWFPVAIPPTAIPNATRAELRLYPNISSLLLESASAILATPHGCAEQTVSAGYANLTAWRFARAAGVTDVQIEKRALANIRLAVDELGSFRGSDGGVRYWATGEPDAAVTAYALSFLIEASTAVPVDSDELPPMVTWLERHQATDGRWLPRVLDTGIQERQALLLTSTVVRSLAAAKKAGAKVSDTALAGGYHHLAQFTDRTDEPYLLANFVLASLDSGDEALTGKAIERLVSMGRDERGGLHWDLRTNSPFYGWGTAGRYETTGLVISALSGWQAAHPKLTDLDSQIRRGAVFLLRGRDSRGNWPSTQATLRAMRALTDAFALSGNAGPAGGSVEIYSNGRMVRSIRLPDDPKAINPILVDFSPFLTAGENQISLAPSSGTPAALMQFAYSYWLPWEKTEARSSPELRFAVHFDHAEVRAGEPVRCSVTAERVGFRGYGMMLAEIGLPPGAEVDRASLESVIEDGKLGVDHYEIFPDRVVLYLWPKAGGLAFNFSFSMRMPMTAKSAASILYDYYNPEALSEVEPSRWRVK